MNEELWEPIRGFPLYHISNHGRVKNIKRDRFLKPTPRKGTYYDYICLYKNGVGKLLCLHQLVGRHFLPYQEGDYVLHREENLPYPDRNHVSNLYLGTHSQNMKDMCSKGRGRKVVVTPEQVKQIRWDYENTKTSHRKLAAKHGVSKSIVTDILMGRTW